MLGVMKYNRELARIAIQDRQKLRLDILIQFFGAVIEVLEPR
jgi:hypothetical protein